MRRVALWQTVVQGQGPRAERHDTTRPHGNTRCILAFRNKILSCFAPWERSSSSQGDPLLRKFWRHRCLFASQSAPFLMRIVSHKRSSWILWRKKGGQTAVNFCLALTSQDLRRKAAGVPLDLRSRIPVDGCHFSCKWHLLEMGKLCSATATHAPAAGVGDTNSGSVKHEFSPSVEVTTRKRN